MTTLIDKIRAAVRAEIRAQLAGCESQIYTREEEIADKVWDVLDEALGEVLDN